MDRHYLKLTDINLANQRVLIRVDMNVPLQNGVIKDETRILSSLPTIEYVLSCGASQVILMTHLGRPIVGSEDSKDSVFPIAQRLTALLKQPVVLLKNWQVGLSSMHKIVMLENVRLNEGEKENDPSLGRRYALLCDVFVNDAFATSHRLESSTDQVARLSKLACAGLLLDKEIQHLSAVFSSAASPCVAIVGGAKISTKLSLLNSLADKVDQLIVGGGIANTFLLAAGYSVGASLVEESCVKEAKHIIQKAKNVGHEVPLPVDVVVSQTLSNTALGLTKSVGDIGFDEKIVDIGPQSIKRLEGFIGAAKTIIWNGPMGVFEINQFSAGTRSVAKAIAESCAFSIAGGGETMLAIHQFDVADRISYISTGGGAFLAFLEGKALPALRALSEKICH